VLSLRTVQSIDFAGFLAILVTILSKSLNKGGHCKDIFNGGLATLEKLFVFSRKFQCPVMT